VSGALARLLILPPSGKLKSPRPGPDSPFEPKPMAADTANAHVQSLVRRYLGDDDDEGKEEEVAAFRAPRPTPPPPEDLGSHRWQPLASRDAGGWKGFVPGADDGAGFGAGFGFAPEALARGGGGGAAGAAGGAGSYTEAVALPLDVDIREGLLPFTPGALDLRAVMEHGTGDAYASKCTVRQDLHLARPPPRLLQCFLDAPAHASFLCSQPLDFS